MTPVAVAFLVASLALAYAGFCRILHMSAQTTLFPTRLAFVALTAAALANVFAVLAWGYRPEWPALALVVAQGGVFLVSRRLWTAGVPLGHRKP